jgi:hypothetical protein
LPRPFVHPHSREHAATAVAGATSTVALAALALCAKLVRSDESRAGREGAGMALVRRFESRQIEPRRIHDEVICGYASTEIAGRRILQLETYGSVDRKTPGRVSQSLQLDEDSARELRRILEHAFPRL